MASVRREGQRGWGWVIALALMVSNWGQDASGQATGAGAGAAAAMFRGDPAHVGRYSGGGRVLEGVEWRVPADGDVISSPTVAAGVVYVGGGGGGLYAIDLATGAVHWRFDAGSAIASSPAV